VLHGDNVINFMHVETIALKYPTILASIPSAFRDLATHCVGNIAHRVWSVLCARAFSSITK
jgi:hypothetical protein